MSRQLHIESKQSFFYHVISSIYRFTAVYERQYADSGHILW